MSQQNVTGLKSFTATEALEAYRRVKLTSGSGVAVEYADAGEDFIGITQEKVAINEPVTVAMKGGSRTFKVVAAEALSVAAALYGANDGKVQDSASGSAYGTALEAATADGDVIEAIFDKADAAQIDGAATSVEPEDDNGSIPILFVKAGITDATTALDVVASLPFKCKVVDWWVISRDTGASNVKLTDGINDITANVAKGTSDDVIVRGGTIVAEEDECALASAIKVEASAAQAFDVFVVVIRIA